MNQEGNLQKTFRAALYARVASGHQADTGTSDSQVSLLRQRIVADGGVLGVGACFIDAGVGGATLMRPGLERLGEQVAAGVIDRLYVLTPDRLARRCMHHIVLLEELQAQGVEVVFVSRSSRAFSRGEAAPKLRGNGLESSLD